MSIVTIQKNLVVNYKSTKDGHPKYNRIICTYDNMYSADLVGI